MVQSWLLEAVILHMVQLLFKSLVCLIKNMRKKILWYFLGDQGVKQADITYKRVSVTRFLEGMPIDMVGGGINEFQVSVGSSSGGILNEDAKKLLPRHNTELGDYRMTLVLYRQRWDNEKFYWSLMP